MATILSRLEDLAFPQPERARLLVGLGAAPMGAFAVAGELAVEADRRKRNPRFRTKWDAVEWLQKYHPEIDLNSPYQPPPRLKR